MPNHCPIFSPQKKDSAKLFRSPENSQYRKYASWKRWTSFRSNCFNCFRSYYSGFHHCPFRYLWIYFSHSIINKKISQKQRKLRNSQWDFKKCLNDWLTISLFLNYELYLLIFICQKLFLDKYLNYLSWPIFKTSLWLFKKIRIRIFMLIMILTKTLFEIQVKS